jgi:hypothetical protein
MDDEVQPKQAVRFTAPVKRVEGKWAVVKLDEGHAVDWPMGLLPPGASSDYDLLITVRLQRRG